MGKRDRKKRWLCRCQAPMGADGTCPFGCPPPRRMTSSDKAEFLPEPQASVVSGS